MYDDEKGASSGLGGLAWYQLGRWSAEGARRNQEFAQARRNQREGRSPVVVDQSDLDALAANRDDLHRAAHHYYHELQLANEEIVKANSHITQLSRDIENQESTNTFLSDSACERKYSADANRLLLRRVGPLPQSLAESRRRWESKQS